ncbi:MAG: DNA polymerase III subunit delta [Oscillibacter sp.]|nr:DNA polymerase III subunit delta [Oscillibacter sp.]
MPPRKPKTDKKADTIRAFRAALASGDPNALGRVYVFHGEETWLRDFYLGELRKLLVPEAFSAFNYHRLDGAGLDVRELSEIAEAMPMMADRTLIVVVDYDMSRLSDGQRAALCAFLADVPEWCCVAFHYDTVPYRLTRQKDSDTEEASDGAPAKKSAARDLKKALDTYAQVLDFAPLGQSELLDWIAAQFRQRGKNIDRRTAEYLVFTCGNLMDGLLQEIGKISDYVGGATVTRRDIDDIADPVLSRHAVDLSNAVSAGNYDAAASVLGDLLKMQTVPYMISGALGKELRRLYTARLALDYGRGQEWLMDIWNMKSGYPAKLALSAARRTTTAWCAWAVRQCEILDRRMKSERSIDPAEELKFLLVRLSMGPGKAQYR